MSRTALTHAALVVLTSSSAFAEGLSGDAQHGQLLFEHQCVACHSLLASHIGPNLAQVYGRKAGSFPGYTYSPAVKASSIVWDDVTLNQWLTSPQKLIPGQKMNFHIPDAQKRADVIAYLKKQSGK